MSTSYLTLVKPAVPLCFSSLAIEAFAEMLGFPEGAVGRHGDGYPVLIELDGHDGAWFDAIKALCKSTGRVVVAVDTNYLAARERGEKGWYGAPRAEIYQIEEGTFTAQPARLHQTRSGKVRLITLSHSEEFVFYDDGRGCWEDTHHAIFRGGGWDGLRRAGESWRKRFEELQAAEIAVQIYEGFDLADESKVVLDLPGVQLRMRRGSRSRMLER